MTFAQHAIDCDGRHECPGGPCIVIVGVQDGAEVWWSHASADIGPDARIGEGFTVEDRRGDAPVVLDAREPTAAEAALLG